MSHVHEKRTPQGLNLRRFGNDVSAGSFYAPEDDSFSQQQQDFRSLGDVAAKVVEDLIRRRLARVQP